MLNFSILCFVCLFALLTQATCVTVNIQHVLTQHGHHFETVQHTNTHHMRLLTQRFFLFAKHDIYIYRKKKFANLMHDSTIYFFNVNRVCVKQVEGKEIPKNHKKCPRRCSSIHREWVKTMSNVEVKSDREPFLSINNTYFDWKPSVASDFGSFFLLF